MTINGSVRISTLDRRSFCESPHHLISCHFDPQTGAPIFKITDPFGISQIVTEFVISQLDQDFVEKLQTTAALDKQLTLIQQYIQERLLRAGPHQPHLGDHEGKKFLHFGWAGLLGGMQQGPEDQNQNSKKLGTLIKGTSFVASTLAVAAGICLLASGVGVAGSMLLSAGMSGGTKAYQTKASESSLLDNAKHASVGAIGGLITGGISSCLGALPFMSAATTAGKIAAKVGCLGAGGAFGGGIEGGVSKFLTGNAQGDWATREEILHSAQFGAVGGAAASVAGGVVGQAASAVSAIGDDVAHAVFKRVVAKAAQGGISAGSSKIATNVCMGDEETPWHKDVLLSTATGALISGAIATVEVCETNKTRNAISTAKKQHENVVEKLDKASTEAVAAEKAAQEAEGHLKGIKETITINEEQLPGQNIELNRQAQVAKKLHTQAAAILPLVDAAQESFSAAHNELITAQQEAHVAQESAAGLLKLIDHRIHGLVDEGCAIKDENGHFQKSYKKNVGTILKLREQAIEGKTIQAKYKGGKISFKVEAAILHEYQQKQHAATRAQQRVQLAEAALQQKQTTLNTHQALYEKQNEIAKNAAKAVSDTQKLIQEKRDAVPALEKASAEAQTTSESARSARVGLEALAENQKQAVAMAHARFDQLKELSKGINPMAQAVQIGRGTERSDRLHLQALEMVTAMASIDCGKDELIKHVVLVQALDHNTIALDLLLKGSADLEKYYAADEKYALNFYMRAVMTREGTIGHHLQIEKLEFRQPIADRITMHWYWNGQVQPHGINDINNWERARIAVLEPLATFENSTHNRPVNVAPYDTLTIGPHILSRESILLVPQDMCSAAEAHLTHFQGRIIGYDDKSKKLREAIIETLKSYYPDTWHLCDANGQLIGHQVKKSPAGYEPKTYLKSKEGQLITLIQNAGERPEDLSSRAMREFRGSKRFIGLHAHYTTNIIEEDAYFKLLKKDDRVREVSNNPNWFVGGLRSITVDSIKRLGVLKAFNDVYQRALTEHEENTGAHRMALYYINEALYTDLISLFLQMHPNAPFDLSYFEVRILFVSCREYLINLLDNMQNCLKKRDPNERQGAIGFFNLYCSTLKECLVHLQQAKREAFLAEEPLHEVAYSEVRLPLCCLVGEEECSKLGQLQNDGVVFDLNQQWPLDHALSAYAEKVLRALPADITQLKGLYKFISLFISTQPHKTYRFGVIRELIRWALLERTYLNLRQDEHSALLAAHLLRGGAWIASYGLEYDDRTINMGDCLFDNVAAQLIEDGTFQGASLDRARRSEVSWQLRQEVAGFMQQKHEFYALKVTPLIAASENWLPWGNGRVALDFDTWEQYLALISKSQIWATEIEIEALASMLNRPIVLMTLKQKPSIYNRDPNARCAPLMLGHKNQNHFESCIPCKGLTWRDVYPMILQKWFV